MRSHREKMASLAPERRARIEERTKIALREIRAVRELREHLGLTQGEFADRVGVSQSRVSRQEAGERRLSLEDFASYVQALGGEWSLTVKLPDLGAVQVAGSDYTRADEG